MDAAKGKKKKTKKTEGKGKENKAASESGDDGDSAPPMQVRATAIGLLLHTFRIEAAGNYLLRPMYWKK